MDDFERRLAIAVKAASPEPPTEIDAEQITRTGPGHRRTAILAPVAAAVVVGASAVAVITLARSHGTHRSAGTAEPSAATTTAATTVAATAAPDVPPPSPDGFGYSEFRMAPPFQEVMGPPPQPRPTCARGQITATAATRLTAGGVLGVVRLVGDVVTHRDGYPLRCTLPISHGPVTLLGPDGRRLGVPRSPGDRTNPPSNPRSDLPLNDGNAIWGFAWIGSYCGVPASAIEMPLRAGAIRASLRGPQPACDQGVSSSSLIDGVAGRPGQPVQPPRPEYSRLRLTGRIEPGTTHTRLAPIDLTLRATGTEPITLDPCPRYAGRDDATARSGGFSDPIRSAYLPCTNRILVIRPGTPLHITVPGTSLEQTPGTGATPGSSISVSIGIAGVPQLVLKTIAH